jgi:hypothetical protein
MSDALERLFLLEKRNAYGGHNVVILSTKVEDGGNKYRM